MAGKTLHLPVKREYFEAIQSGIKTEEYRLVNSFWSTRLSINHAYEFVEITLGYPKAGDSSRRIKRHWKGFEVKKITHPLFGPEPVYVYAIDVTGADV